MTKMISTARLLPSSLGSLLGYKGGLGGEAGGGDPITIAAMVKLMLTKLDWYGTLFPRIPIPIQVRRILLH